MACTALFLISTINEADLFQNIMFVFYRFYDTIPSNDFLSKYITIKCISPSWFMEITTAKLAGSHNHRP